MELVFQLAYVPHTIGVLQRFDRHRETARDTFPQQHAPEVTINEEDSPTDEDAASMWHNLAFFGLPPLLQSKHQWKTAFFVLKCLSTRLSYMSKKSYGVL